MRNRLLWLGIAAAAVITAAAPAGAANFGTVDHPATAKECSACHMAYQPQLLPERSWKALMGDLSNHFGEDASLAPDVQADIEAFLVANAADAPANRRIRGLLKGLKDSDVPLRVTEMPWWKRSHGEVNPQQFTKPDIKSAANCAACHRGADKGYFADD